MARALSAINPTPSCTEHDLVAAVRRGDDRAFEELFSRYRGRIGSYIFGMVGDHARAEDITQDVFISALRRLRDTERPIAFKAWIYEIAKNACIDEFRRARRAHEVPLGDDDDSGAGEWELRSRDMTPDDAVESKQRLDHLCGAFGGLSEPHHRILVLRELEGLSYTEIAERMNMSRAMVESTLFRARRRLTSEYEDLVTGRRCEQVRTAVDSGCCRSARSLRIRERRQLARHLSHCQPCRRYARMAGVDEALFKAPSVVGKVAALLPIPWLRLRRLVSPNKSVGGSARPPVGMLRSMQAMAQFGDAAGPAVTVGRAAAAAVALAIAGAGAGGLVTSMSGGQSPKRSTVHVQPAASRGAPAQAGSGSAAAQHSHAAAAASGSGTIGGNQGLPTISGGTTASAANRSSTAAPSHAPGTPQTSQTSGNHSAPAPTLPSGFPTTTGNTPSGNLPIIETPPPPLPPAPNAPSGGPSLPLPKVTVPQAGQPTPPQSPTGSVTHLLHTGLG